MKGEWPSITCGQKGCHGTISPDNLEPDRCVLHGTNKKAMKQLREKVLGVSLESRLASFVRQVGRGEPEVGGECHCGGLFLAYTSEKTASVAHTRPTCEDFQECQPDKYMHRVRMRKSV